MTLKRKRRVLLAEEGLASGETLVRHNLVGSTASPWGWVGTEVKHPSDITAEHRRRTCGLSEANLRAACPNQLGSAAKSNTITSHGPTNNDIIIISDGDDRPSCSKKDCRKNVNCLNYLGQEIWENDDQAVKTFLKAASVGNDPKLRERRANYPVGLKNLGATCYANAFLQVWFRNPKFRAAVFRFPGQDKLSPIYQLQITFAALQASLQAVFNPIKFVESLRLNTDEQQDAQEFSKLFISLLDEEFQKQTHDGSLKSVITDQFQGMLSYTTTCNSCGNSTGRESDFLELEVTLENGCTLRSCISNVLQPEVLHGDNKYLCSYCESLQEATRQIKLRKLPPVLHFSLLRFVYDVSSMTRKKSTHMISFPSTIDMKEFLDDFQEAQGCLNEPYVYELRSILLHKGTSAYHGHYEAQVYDSGEKTWFQFNDEAVTKTENLSIRRRARSISVEVLDGNDSVPKPKPRASARKKRRIEDTDEEDNSEQTRQTDNFEIRSKDAYMLIYVRSDLQSGNSTPVVIPTSAQNAVDKMNADYVDECLKYTNRLASVHSQFEEVKQRVKRIYLAWDEAPLEPSFIVSRQSLERWLRLCLEKPTESQSAAPSERISIQDILCEHGSLNPLSKADMKRIKQKALRAIITQTDCVIEPQMTLDDICHVCVSKEFTERLYLLEHPRMVRRYEALSASDESFWISKQWLRDWKLHRPKMHFALEGDPSPGSPEYDLHVRCQHGKLSPKPSLRFPISAEAYYLLKELYPSWKALSTDEQPCQICEDLLKASKELKSDMRRRADEEKALFKHLYDNGFAISQTKGDDIQAIIPRTFLRAWRQWIINPSTCDPPDIIDTSVFFCDHGSLNIDPNSPSDMDDSLTFIEFSDWERFSFRYDIGRLISLRRQYEEDGVSSYVHDIPVCSGCRVHKKLNFTETHITICLENENGDDIERLASSRGAKLGGSSPRKAPSRQSKRIRDIQGHTKQKRLQVSKTTTVMQLKIMVQDHFDMPIMYQKLFHLGKELKHTDTIDSLGVLVNDVLHLRRETEEVADFEETSKREESSAFGGTLLGSSLATKSDTPQATLSRSHTPAPKQVTCPACTFSNDAEAFSCEICDTDLI